MIATRSPIVRLGVQVISPFGVVVAAFLFFAGHNRPGGGFVAGLVLGAIVALRAVAGLAPTLAATALLASGAILAALVALAPLVFGSAVLDQVVISETVPVLGTIKSGTALVFDAAVTLIVVGLVASLLDGLGAAAPTRSEDASEAAS
jgi:multisubunit Na+/H+ antiporter MnhB subunit